LSRHQNPGQHRKLQTANKACENVAKGDIHSGSDVLRADDIPGVLGTIYFRIFCLPVSSSKAQ